MEFAPTASPKIFDLPPEIVTMIGKAVKNDPEDPRGGLRSLSRLNATCRYMRECTLASLWGIVLTKRSDFSMPKSRSTLVKAICYIPSFEAVDVEDHKDVSVMGANLNLVSSYRATNDSSGESMREDLEIKVRLLDPEHIEELVEAIIMICQAWTKALGRSAEIKTLDIVEISPGFKKEHVEAVWRELGEYVAAKFCVVIRMGFAEGQGIEESHKHIMSAALAFGKPVYVIYDGGLDLVVPTIRAMIEATDNPTKTLQIYLKYDYCQCSVLNHVGTQLDQLWNFMGEKGISNLKFGVAGGGSCMDREGYELDVKEKPSVETSSRRLGEIKWEPEMLWD